MAGGATAAECVVREGDEFSTLVRLGQVETLKEASSRSIGVRVFHGQRSASTYSSDFSREALDRMLKSALELAKITSEDPFSGIPEASQLGSLPGDLDLYSADVYSLPGEERINYARRAEKAALDYDPRIKNSEGGSFDAATGHKVLANSHGFVGEYRRSYCSVAAVPIAQSENGAMQRDYWFSVARNSRQDRGPTHFEAAGRAQGEDGQASHHSRSDGGRLDPGTYLRRHQWRFRLSRRFVPGGQAGREDRGRPGHRD
jgi:PmbA protein